MILKGYIIGTAYAVLSLLLAFVLYKLGVEKKYTRKSVHILIGFEWIILGFYQADAYKHATYHILIFCLAALALLSLVYKKQLLPMISSDADNSPGTVYYCLSMSIMAAVSLIEPRFMIPFGIAALCTSLGDGFAGVIGQAVKKYNPRVWKNKTLFGTASGFLFSFLTVIVFEKIFSLGLSGWAAVLIALFATELELVTGLGLDNVSLPLGVSALSYFLINYNEATLGYIVPILATPIMLAVVIDKKVLTRAGTAAAIILDVIVSVAFGNMGFLMMALFLVGGVAIDKIKNKFKRHKSSVEAKTDKTRDVIQVLANSLPAMVLSVAYFVSGYKAFTVAFAVCAAEALADTAASGLGAFSKHTYDLFKLRPIEKGMSGGMSLMGTASALLGALVSAMIPAFFGIYDEYHVIFVTLSAFGGAIFDSLLGSLLQVKYRCTKCGKMTEKKEHCKRPAKKVGGVFFIDNDVVNFASGVFSVLLSLGLYHLVF